jgi:hypothetical protein
LGLWGSRALAKQSNCCVAAMRVGVAAVRVGVAGGGDWHVAGDEEDKEEKKEKKLF